jgi:hypothetical protein
VEVVYCWKCHAANPAGGYACRECGASDPEGRRPTPVGVLVLATTAAAVFTGVYALALSLTEVWDRWQRKFDDLPDDHALRGHAVDVAVAVGVGVFLVVWLGALAGLSPRTRTR